MKYAVIADIHSNRKALEAVLEAARRRQVERFYCLGDLVGYGADPGWCLTALREVAVKTVQGNHDAAVGEPEELRRLNPDARRALIWTASQLTLAEIDYLQSLPPVEEEAGIFLVHSSFQSPRNWDYIFTPEDARFSLQRLPGTLGFFGHTHRPGFFRLRGGEVSLVAGARIRLQPGDRVLINPGSVGQPRDRDPRAAFAVGDRESGTVEIVRVDYPVGEAQRKIRAAGLPVRLADRLALGR